MRQSGVSVMCLLALSDGGIPSYDAELANGWLALAFLALAVRLTGCLSWWRARCRAGICRSWQEQLLLPTKNRMFFRN